MLRAFCLQKTSCEPNILFHTWYQQIVTLDSISLRHKAPSACGQEEDDDSSTDSCKYTGLVFRLWPKPATNPFLWASWLRDHFTQAHRWLSFSMPCSKVQTGLTALTLNHYCSQESPDLCIYLTLTTGSLLKCTRKAILLSITHIFWVSHSNHFAYFALLATVLGRSAYSVPKTLELNCTLLVRQSPSAKRRLKIAKQLHGYVGKPQI